MLTTGIDLADTVSEITDVKHAYRKGIDRSWHRLLRADEKGPSGGVASFAVTAEYFIVQPRSPNFGAPAGAGFAKLNLQDL